MDSVWSIDPKTKREVEKSVDVPYNANEIINSSVVPLAPPFAPLARWMPKLSIVHAFRQNAANHPSGLVHTACCNNTAVPGTPTLLELLGTRSHSAAVGAISIGATFPSVMSPTYLGQPAKSRFGRDPGLFDHLDKAAPEDLISLSKLFEREAAGAASTSPSSSRTVENIRASSALLAQWAKSPRFTPEEWQIPMEGDYHNGADLQRAVWMFENGITRCAAVYMCSQDYDTHVWNHTQPPLIEYTTRCLDRLFQLLDSRIVDGKPLSEQTVVVIGSEIGRFPRLNAARGKDHFPQVSYLFYGPWFNTGNVFGKTDTQMIARPISLETGKPDAGGHVLALDDIGTTLLALDGAKPDIFGYTGAKLSFLLA